MFRECMSLVGECTDGSFALKRIRRNQVRKGMVLIGKTETPPRGVQSLRWETLSSSPAVKRFEGMVMVLHHASTIQPKYQAMMHCGAIRVSRIRR